MFEKGSDKKTMIDSNVVVFTKKGIDRFYEIINYMKSQGIDER